MENTPIWISGQNIMFIMVWKVAGEFVSPKNMTTSSESPLGVRNAAFHSLPSQILTLLYLQHTSNLVNKVHPLKQSMTCGINRDMLWF